MKVVEIDEEKYTVTVEGMGFKFTKANLRSLSLSEDKGVIIVPKVDSIVYVMTTKRENPLIISYSEIDKVIIKNDNSQIVMDNDKVSIIADKIYINTEGETEPMVKGETLAGHLDTIYDFINDLYEKLLTAVFATPAGPTTGILPPHTVDIPIKQGEVATNKAQTGQTKSTKNFTE
jgi:hypothetical protein